jgi:hypothetical protein
VTFTLQAVNAHAAYLTITKLTDNQVVCPVGGCSSILNSPFAQIGPVPLPALGMLGYGSVAACSWLGAKQAYDLSFQLPTASRLRQLASTQQAILLGTAPFCTLFSSNSLEVPLHPPTTYPYIINMHVPLVLLWVGWPLTASPLESACSSRHQKVHLLPGIWSSHPLRNHLTDALLAAAHCTAFMSPQCTAMHHVSGCRSPLVFFLGKVLLQAPCSLLAQPYMHAACMRSHVIKKSFTAPEPY